MAEGVQSFSCPRCRQGEFRALPGPDGHAFCPWCGTPVPGGTRVAAAAPAPPDPVKLTDLAIEAALQSRNDAGDPGLRQRLEEAERGRAHAEAELRRELEKRAGIKKAVLEEMGRLEAQLAETQQRIRRKDAEHAAALADLAGIQEAREKSWAAERTRLMAELGEQEKVRAGLEAKAQERHKTLHDVQAALDNVRIDDDRVRTELARTKAAAEEVQADLRKRLATAESRLKTLVDADLQLRDLKKQLQEERNRSEGLQSEVEKREQRIKDLQLLVKTLGERLNDLASRRF